MSNLVTDFYAELKSIASAAVSLPTPATGHLNVITTIQGMKRSIVEQLREANARLVLPMLVLQFGKFEEEKGLGINSVGLMRAPVTLFYLIQWGGAWNNQDGAYEGVQQIKAVIDTPPSTFTTFYPIEEGVIDSSDECPVNAALFADSQVQIVSAELRYNPGLLVGLY